jgi:hypothetical protein
MYVSDLTKLFESNNFYTKIGKETFIKENDLFVM